QVETTLWNPEEFRVLGNRLIFASSDQLWATDGTPGGAQLLTGVSPVFNLTPAGDVLYFTAFDPTSGFGLWKTDGTPGGTGIVSSLNHGATTENPQLLTPAGGKLFFQATDDAGTELWISDGTGPGTARLADVQPGAGSSSPQSLTAAGGTLFFSAATD